MKKLLHIVSVIALCLGFSLTMGCSSFGPNPDETPDEVINSNYFGAGKLMPDGSIQELDELIWIRSANTVIMPEDEWTQINREDGLTVPTNTGFDLKIHVSESEFILPLVIWLVQNPEPDDYFVLDEIVTDASGNYFMLGAFYVDGEYLIQDVDGDEPIYYVQFGHSGQEDNDQCLSQLNNWRMTVSSTLLPVNTTGGGRVAYVYSRENEWDGDPDAWLIDDLYSARLWTWDNGEFVPVTGWVNLTHMAETIGGNLAVACYITTDGQIIADYGDDWVEIQDQDDTIIIWFGTGVPAIPPAFLNPLINAPVSRG